MPARGTRLKTPVITITYSAGSIPDFFAAHLKRHVEIRGRRPFCWYFCWYRGNKRSRRISLFPNEGIEQMARKNDGASAKTIVNLIRKQRKKIEVARIS